jgi:hypothetical protein
MGMSPDVANPHMRSFLGAVAHNQELWNKSHMIPNPSNVPLPRVPVSGPVAAGSTEAAQ